MTDFLQSHWLDITTTLLGLAYIILEYRASIWMWLAGFLMQALGIVLYYEKGLYADCAMEFSGRDRRAVARRQRPRLLPKCLLRISPRGSW